MISEEDLDLAAEQAARALLIITYILEYRETVHRPPKYQRQALRGLRKDLERFGVDVAGLHDRLDNWRYNVAEENG